MSGYRGVNLWDESYCWKGMRDNYEEIYNHTQSLEDPSYDIDESRRIALYICNYQHRTSLRNNTSVTDEFEASRKKWMNIDLDLIDKFEKLPLRDSDNKYQYSILELIQNNFERRKNVLDRGITLSFANYHRAKTVDEIEKMWNER